MLSWKLETHVFPDYYCIDFDFDIFAFFIPDFDIKYL